MPFHRVFPGVPAHFLAPFLAISAAAAALAEGAGLAGPDPKPRADTTDAPTGAFIAYFPRPVFARETRACSTRYPFCVHAADRRDHAAAKAALPAFERAWSALTVLGAPAPDPDPVTLAYDVFIADETATRLEARDVRSHVDRGRSFTLLDRRMREGCNLDAAAMRTLARASLYHAAPATEEGTAIAQAEALTELAVPCSDDADGADLLQQHADLALCGRARRRCVLRARRLDVWTLARSVVRMCASPASSSRRRGRSIPR